MVRASVLSCFSRVGFFVTLWTVALQAPLPIRHRKTTKYGHIDEKSKRSSVPPPPIIIINA